MNSLPSNTTVETISVRRVTIDIKSPFADVVGRFRTLVPQIKLGDLRAQTSKEGIAELVQDTASHTGFVLFAEFNHGSWIRYFPPFNLECLTEGGDNNRVSPGVHRFIFGNPVYAITMIRESIEAALHVPLDCGFFEQQDGSTRMVMLLPSGLVAGAVGASDNPKLQEAAGDLEGKIFHLIEEIAKE